MNHYEVLGVGPDATESQIKEAYRVQAMKWHPDRHEGAAAKGEAERRFKDLAVAYRTLRNAVERANYDRQLEQQLHQEYNNRQQADAKQKEQARQERAQQEHARAQAKQKQARQDSPKADFANTGPQFEEATASDDEANKMFYEQMLDMATEMATRGFPEFNILKALVALGCPETLAKVVAGAAAKQSRGQAGTNPNSQDVNAALPNFDDASWEELQPHYVAAIMGDQSGRMLSEDRFNAIEKIRKDRWNYCVGIGFVILVLITIFGLMNSATQSELLWILTTVGFFFLCCGLVAKNTFLGTDRKPFRIEFRRRYYLDAFKVIHLERKGGPRLDRFNVSAFFFHGMWLGYRRMTWLAYGVTAVNGVIGLAFIAFGVSFLWTLLSVFVVPVITGYYGNRMYFNMIHSKIRDAIEVTPSKQILVALRQSGGPNKLGWIAPMLLGIVISIPGIAIQSERQEQAEVIAQQERAAEQAASDARQRADTQQAESQAKSAYRSAVAAIEARHPELNPDSASYNPKAEAWVVERKEMYDKAGGRSEVVALQQAVTDYETAIRAAGNSSATQSRRASTHDSTNFFGGVGERISLNFRSIEIRSLLQVLEDFAGVRITVDDQVRGSVNIRVAQQPWTQALTQLLQENQLAIIRINNGYYVFPASFSDETAIRRANQSRGSGPQVLTSPEGSISRSSEQERKTAETICRTWPEACR